MKHEQLGKEGTNDSRIRYFMSYSTANDKISYFEDFANFLNLSKYDPGVDKVELYIAVSEVVPRRSNDDKAWERLSSILQRNPFMQIRSFEYKSNRGRDFSSTALNLRKVLETGNDQDYILCVNRSAYGPSMPSWYLAYIDQLERYSKVSLCGSTINFLGHPRRKKEGNFTHVQSYAYLSKLIFMQELKEHFPGEDKTERLDIIEEGEIGLSQFFLQKGYCITSLYEPGYVFNLEHPYEAGLERRDIKKEAYNVPFRYKYSSYIRRSAGLVPAAYWLLSRGFQIIASQIKF